MTREDANPRDAFAPALAVIAMIALAGRLLFLYGSRHWVLRGDGYAYRIEAARLLEGQVQGPLHPPAWTFLVAVPPGLGFDGRIHQQVFTALIGVATVVMIGLAGRYVFGRRVGLIAAAIAAVYPNMWIYEREILSEPLTMFMVATTILVVYRFRDRPSTAGAAGLGALLALSGLVRSELIVLSLLVVTPVILSRAGVAWSRRVGWLALAGATTLVVLAPWTAYNSTRYARPVPLSAGLGTAMAAGNCPPTYTGPKVGTYEFGCIIVAKVSTDLSVADAEFRDRALTYMTNNRRRAVEVSLIRLGRTFNLYRPFQQARFESERGSALWLTRSAVVAYWILAPLAVVGAVLTRRRRIPLYPILAFPLISVLAVAPTIGAVRYRAVAEVSIVLLGAVTLDHLLRWWQRRGAVAAAATTVPDPKPDLEPDLDSDLEPVLP